MNKGMQDVISIKRSKQMAMNTLDAEKIWIERSNDRARLRGVPREELDQFTGHSRHGYALAFGAVAQRADLQQLCSFINAVEPTRQTWWKDLLFSSQITNWKKDLPVYKRVKSPQKAIRYIEDNQEKIESYSVRSSKEQIPTMSFSWAKSLWKELSISLTVSLTEAGGDTTIRTEAVDQFNALLGLIIEHISPDYGYIAIAENYPTVTGTFVYSNRYSVSDTASDMSAGLRWGYRYYIDNGTLVEKQDGQDESGEPLDWQLINGSLSKLKGTISQVYRENFLTSIHLDKECNGVRFQDWIEADAARGTLRQLSDAIWQWSTPEGNIKFIEQACCDFGLFQTRSVLKE